MSTISPTIENKEVPALPTWKVIWKMLLFRPWLWFVDLISVSLFRVCFQIAPALIIKAFFDMLTGTAKISFGIWAIVAAFGTLWIGRIIGSYGFYYADVPIFADMSTLLRKNLLKYILRRPGASQLPDSPGEAVSRFKTDVNEIPLFVIMINDIMIGLVIIAVAIFLMTQISPSVTVMALIPLVIVGMVANLATGRIEHYRRTSRQAGGKVTGFIGEFFGAVQAVKVATAEKNVIGYFHKLNEERRILTIREKLFDEVLGSIYRNTSTLGTGVILVLVGQSMRTGNFTLGDFSLFVYLLQSMGDLTTMGGMLAARYKQLTVSVQRMYHLMENAPLDALVEHSQINLDGPLPEVIYPAKTASDRLNELAVDHLTFHYPGSTNGIDDISLNIESSRVVLVLAKQHYCALCLDCFPLNQGRYAGTEIYLPRPAIFSYPRAVRTQHKCRACLATPCETTYCLASIALTMKYIDQPSLPSWIKIWNKWMTISKPWSARAV
jgi:ATP-binding cassette subfamily B protein